MAAGTNKAGLRGGMAEALRRRGRVRRAVRGSTVPEELIATMAPDVDRVRTVQPGPGDPPGRRPPGTPRSWPPGAATSPTRSTTSLAFPGVFRGALDAGARRITERMKLAAAEAIAAVAAEDLAAGHDRAERLDPRVAPEVAAAVAQAAREDGVA